MDHSTIGLVFSLIGIGFLFYNFAITMEIRGFAGNMIIKIATEKEQMKLAFLALIFVVLGVIFQLAAALKTVSSLPQEGGFLFIL